MNKTLSDYELSCGYIQKNKVYSNHLFTMEVELYKEHEAYHIRAFKHVNNSSSCTRLAWEVRDSFEEAQDEFNKLSNSILRGEYA